MSSAGLKRTAEAILKTLNKSAGSEDKKGSARREAERAPGQLFVFDRAAVDAEIDKVSNFFRVDLLSKKSKKAVIDKFESWIETQESNVKNKKKLNLLKAHAAKLEKEHKGKDLKYYIVGSYSTVRKEKRNILANGLEAAYRDLPNKQPFAKNRFAEKFAGSQIAGEELAGIQLGHGEYGAAASQITASRTQQLIENTDTSGADFNKGDDAKLQNIVSTYKAKAGVKLDHKTMITSTGKLRKDYVMVISMEGVESNQHSAAMTEKPAMDSIRENAEKIINNPNSTLLRDTISMVLKDALTRKTRTVTKVRYTGHRPKSKIKEQSSTTFKTLIPITNTIPLIKAKSLIDAATVKNIRKPKMSRKTKSQGSPTLPGEDSMSAINMINSKLPEALMKNMNSPALQNQTGRFASSVKAIRSIPGKGRQWNTIQYTYDKDPYQVFEMGQGDRRWATTARDPRKLIEKTVREIAVEQAMGRFKMQRI